MTARGGKGEPTRQRENLLLPGVTRWPQDPDKPVISLRGVVKRYGGRAVLDGLDLDIHTGLTTVIAGGSGSGKSVLLRLMNGLTLPDEGDVWLFGENTREVGDARLLELRKRVTMMFQSYALMDSVTVAENVGFPLFENTSLPRAEIMTRVSELLATLGLGDAGKKLPSELSGGMKKRVSFARAIITNPEVVLFDEPTTGLDPVMIAFVDEMIQDTREKFGITSVIISHDMTSTMNLADRLAMLEDGRISAYGTLDEVLQSGRELVDIFFEGAGRLEAEVKVESRRESQRLWRLEPGEEPVVELSGVSKSFGSHKVLSGIDLIVPKGKITVLIGGSGSGKSVIMKHIIGLMHPDEGVVRVFGEDLAKLARDELLKLRERLGMVFQGAALLDALTAAQNVAFPLIEHRFPKAEVKARTDEILETLKLTEIRDHMPNEMSNGQRKRVGLARAMVTRPELIIYDEPTTGQDPVLTRYLDDMIVEAQSLFPITSLVVSHDMPSAFRVADQIAMLADGKILAAETPERLRAAEDPLVRRFIYAGTPAGRQAASELEAAAEG